MNRTIIFSPDGGGHHIEYIHHIYEECVKRKDRFYIFLVNVEFQKNMKLLQWKQSDNVVFDFFESDCLQCSFKLKLSYITTSFINGKLKEWDADELFSDVLMQFIPWGAFLLRRRAKLSGIIYKIYLRDERSRGLRHILDWNKYFLLRSCKVFKSVYILNDEESSARLNKIYHTKKFAFLPDPSKPLPDSEEKIRIKHNISKDDILLAHIGAMAERKGTLNILRSINYLSPSQKEKYVFVFSGKVGSDIRDEFYKMVETQRKECRIIVEDGFFPFEHIGAVIRASNVLLAPYKESGQSSGIVGYASQLGVPMIAPDKGLLGHLVKSNSLGIVCDCSNPLSLAATYSKVAGCIASRKYFESHSVKSFTDVLFANNL